MKFTNALLVVLLASAILAGCSDQTPAASSKQTATASQVSSDVSSEAATTAFSLEMLDNTKWNFNADDNVYWQVGVAYCAAPVAESYQTLGVFVPAAYMSATDNGDDTYTCALNPSGQVDGYTAETAPIVIPVNTPGYMAMKAPTDYVDGVADYTKAGFVYVNAGCRGRDSGAPAGVTDLKAAVRFVRYCADAIPGSKDRIFTFGMSGGGAQSALMGATGDSALYTPYLEAIGAVSDESDAVAGSMCWCPITNLDYANEAYEWNMGMTRNELDAGTWELSNAMAVSFAEYLNALELKGPDGAVLSLEESDGGLYMAGSYYDYLKQTIEESLNNFLADTSFPYAPQSKGPGGPGVGMSDVGQGAPPEGLEPGGPAGDMGDTSGDGIVRNEQAVTKAPAVTYQTAAEYIASLNGEADWIQYGGETNSATITSVEDFVKACKPATKSVGAFDALDATQGENELFGYGDGAGVHFDPVMAELLSETEFGAAYAADLKKIDHLGNTVDYRMNMYNPMYYLSDYYEGYKTASVAQFWRIRTGINQGDTALATEVNLALAVENYGTKVDFETVWGQGHTMAERSGDSTENFIAWVNGCLDMA